MPTGIAFRAAFAGALLMTLAPLALGDDDSPAERLNKLYGDEWERTLREAPTFASYLGDKRYNDRWPDVSLEAIARRNAEQKKLLTTLDAIDSKSLKGADRLNYALFRKQIEFDQEEYPFRWWLVP